jgi:hypothetical protein
MKAAGAWIALASAAAMAAGFALARAPRVDRLGNPDFAERDGKLLYRGQPFTGIEVIRFPDGRAQAETEYREGLREGRGREYATTGALRAEWSYHRGRKDGIQRGWYIEGPRRFEQPYRDGVLDGTLTEWHLNGAVANQQVYVDGVETARKVLFPGSELYSNYVRRDGRTFGLDGGALCLETKREGER